MMEPMRRTAFQVKRDLMEMMQKGPTKVQHLLCGGYLTWKTMQRHLNRLMYLGLVEVVCPSSRELSRDKRTRRLYGLTDSGHQVVKLFGNPMVDTIVQLASSTIEPE